MLFFSLALILLICSSQINLLSSVILKNWVLSLEGIILFLSMISIGSSFFILNVMITVLLGKKIKPLSAAHASDLLVTPCNALASCCNVYSDHQKRVIHPLHFPVLLIYHWLPLRRGLHWAPLLVEFPSLSICSHFNLSFTNQFSDELSSIFPVFPYFLAVQVSPLC